MIDLFVLIFCSFIIANQIAVYSKNYSSVLVAVKKNFIIKLLWILLVLLLILFSGLRTSYNDTGYYILSYKLLDINSIGLSTLFKPYGGFDIYQFFLKKFISQNPQTLIMASSMIVNTIYIWFFSKYSKHFGWTILSYFILGPYIFSMAGMKQILSMSLSLFAIDNLIENNNVKFLIWIILSSLFHPYILCFLILPFINKGICDKRFIITVLIIFFIVININNLITLAGYIGKDYTVEELSNNTINPFRVIVEMIPILIMFLFKNRLRSSNNKLFIMGINMMILNTLFISLGLIFNPIYFGRIGTYFSLINALTIPHMLYEIFKRVENIKMYFVLYYSFFIVYFILDLTKLGTISIFQDIFKHISLF